MTFEVRGSGEKVSAKQASKYAYSLRAGDVGAVALRPSVRERHQGAYCAWVGSSLRLSLRCTTSAQLGSLKVTHACTRSQHRGAIEAVYSEDLAASSGELQSR